MLVTRIDKGRLQPRTFVLTVNAARMEMTSRGWIDRAWHITFQDLPFFLETRIGDGHRRKKRLGVGVFGVMIEIGARKPFPRSFPDT